MKMFSHSLPVRARQLLKAPYTERYVRCCERTAVSHRLLLDLYLYVEQFVHVGLPFVHRGIEKIKYSVILSTYHGKQIKLSVIVRQLRRGGGENDGQ